MFTKILDWLAGNKRVALMYLLWFILGVLLSNLGWFLK